MTEADKDRAAYSASLDTAIELITAFMADADNGTPGALADDMIAAIIDDLKTDTYRLPYLLSGLGTIGAALAVSTSANSKNTNVTPHSELRRIADTLRSAPSP